MTEQTSPTEPCTDGESSSNRSGTVERSLALYFTFPYTNAPIQIYVACGPFDKINHTIDSTHGKPELAQVRVTKGVHGKNQPPPFLPPVSSLYES